MPEWNGLGKLLIIAGAAIALAGGVLLLFGRFPGVGSEGGWLAWLGKLPGDIFIKREGFSFYAPITTCLLISLTLTIIFYLVSSLWKR